MTVPFLSHISQATFDWLRAHGELVAYQKVRGHCSHAAPRCSCQNKHRPEEVTVATISCCMDSRLRGMPL